MEISPYYIFLYRDFSLYLQQEKQSTLLSQRKVIKKRIASKFFDFMEQNISSEGVASRTCHDTILVADDYREKDISEIVRHLVEYTAFGRRHADIRYSYYKVREFAHYHTILRSKILHNNRMKPLGGTINQNKSYGFRKIECSRTTRP